MQPQGQGTQEQGAAIALERRAAVAVFCDNVEVARLGPAGLRQRTAEAIIVNGGLAVTDSYLTADGPVSTMFSTDDGQLLIERGLAIPLVRDTAKGLLEAFDQAVAAGTYARSMDKRPYIALLDRAAQRTSVRWSAGQVRAGFSLACETLYNPDMLIALGVTPQGADLVSAAFVQAKKDFAANNIGELDPFTRTWIYNRVHPEGGTPLEGLDPKDAGIIWAVANAAYAANIPNVVQLPMAVGDNFGGIEGLRALRERIRPSADLRVASGSAVALGQPFVGKISDPSAAWLVSPQTLGRLQSHHLEAAVNVSQAVEYHAARLAFLANQNLATWTAFEDAFQRYVLAASREVVELFVKEDAFSDPADVTLQLLGDNAGVRMQAEGAGIAMSGLPADFDRDPIQLLARHFEVPDFDRDRVDA